MSTHADSATLAASLDCAAHGAVACHSALTWPALCYPRAFKTLLSSQTLAFRHTSRIFDRTTRLCTNQPFYQQLVFLSAGKKFDV